MSRFTKSSLTYKYKWHVNNFRSPTFLEDDIINVDNGHDVLNFINRFFVEEGLSSIETFKRLEYMLHQQLPMDIHSRKEISQWVRKNWNNNFYKKSYAAK